MQYRYLDHIQLLTAQRQNKTVSSGVMVTGISPDTGKLGSGNCEMESHFFVRYCHYVGFLYFPKCMSCDLEKNFLQVFQFVFYHSSININVSVPVQLELCSCSCALWYITMTSGFICFMYDILCFVTMSRKAITT